MRITRIAKYSVLGILTLITCFSIFKFIIAPHIFGKQYTIADNKKFKLLIIWTQGLGERELLARYKIAAQNIGIELRTVSATLHDNLIETMVGDLPKAAIKAMQPDLAIMLQNDIPPYPGVVTYRVLDTNHLQFLLTDHNNKWQFGDKYLTQFDGYLAPFPRLDLVAEACKNINKPFYGMAWYPTVQKVNYTPATPNLLFYNGGSGTLRNSEKYRAMFTLLSRKPYFYLINELAYTNMLNVKNQNLIKDFTHEREWKSKISSSNTLLPFDGVSLLNKHHDTGVALILHSESHLPYGTPTGRIFEAAAANSVIISDDHAFIRENFGDNVLYINLDQTPTDIVAQIDKHMQWIKDNPLEAQHKAQQCHDIFLSKFTLEDQILKLIALHKSRQQST